MIHFYTGTLNHDPTYIRRDLFEKYGYYDEALKIVSDWKWFMQTIIFGGEQPQYVDINVTLFDMIGVSETNIDLVKEERKTVLGQMFPQALIADYELYDDPIDHYHRLKRHPWALKFVDFLERCLFKSEKTKKDY